MSSFFEFREKMMRKGEDPPPAPVPPPKDTGPTPLTVSQLTLQIDRAIRSGMPQEVMVRGECSNCHAARESGHFYFTLKDAKACIDCMMYRDDFALLPFDPTDGVELLATGTVKVYGQRGRYQLYAKSLEPLGKGALDLAFQKLHKKLQAEGLFAKERKKPLPKYPIDIALVTGRETAAIHDLAKVFRRFPWLKLRLFHVPVQGEGAAQRIADMLDHISTKRKFDVIVLARGGGSLEDLWQFNDEHLARTIAASRIPIVTGIGHEIDTSIADLVADYHAHTPTEAAQVITAHWRTAEEDIAALAMRLRGVMRHIISDARHRLNHVQRHEIFRRPTDRIRQLQQLLDDHQRSLALATTNRLRRAVTRIARAETLFAARHPRHIVGLHVQRLDNLRERLNCAQQLRRERLIMQVDALERQLNAVSPQSVLKRGYSMTLLKRTGAVLKSIDQVKPGDVLVTRVADGQVESVAEDSSQPKLFP